jgi:hypothetical protein
MENSREFLQKNLKNSQELCHIPVVPATWGDEVGGSLDSRAGNQPGQYSKTLSQKQKEQQQKTPKRMPI